MKSIQITEKQKKIVLAILIQYFPDARFFIFGSRATNTSVKPFSDLDIAIRDTKVIGNDDLAKANEDFASSDLPFKVDLVDLASISAEFKLNIEPDFVEMKL